MTHERFARVHHNDPDFYLVSDVEESGSVRHEKAILCTALMALLIVLMAVPSMEVVYAAFIVAGLIYKFGAPVKTFIEKYFNVLSIAFFVLLFLGFYLIKFVF